MKVFFQKYRNYFDAAILLTFFAFGCIWMYHTYESQQTQLHIAEKILRFHVRANSNSNEDQELKLKVRDAVGAYINQELAGTGSLKECTQAVQNHLPDIIHTAEKIIEKEGGQYLESYRLFDIYEGNQIKIGFKSMAYTLTFRALDRTLEDETVNEAVSRMIHALEAEGIELRK